MTELLDRAVAAVRQLPPRKQDEIARGLLDKAREPGCSDPRDCDPGGTGAPPVADAFRLWPRGRRR